MLRSVEAIIEPDGTIRILEPLQVKVATKAIVTLLEEEVGVRLENQEQEIDSPVWRAYQESKRERGEVYNRLAKS
jgi:hypothetical protein